MSDEFVGVREWYSKGRLQGYDMGWNNALNVLEEKIIEHHHDQGCKVSLSSEWILKIIQNLKKSDQSS